MTTLEESTGMNKAESSSKGCFWVIGYVLMIYGLKLRAEFIHAIVSLELASESRRQRLAAVVDLISIIEQLKVIVEDRGRSNSAHPN
jgi:hypothetical protein